MKNKPELSPSSQSVK